MAEKDKDDEKEEIVPVGPGVDYEPTDDDQPEADDEESSPAKKAQQSSTLDEKDPDDEDEDEGDERVARGEDDKNEDVEEKRQRRRAERRKRKEDYRRTQREVAFLRQRNEQLERRFSDMEARQHETETLSVEQRISQIDSQLKVAQGVHAKAVEKGAGAEATEALEIMDELKEQRRRLEAAKESKPSRKDSRPSGGGSYTDSAVVMRAQQWMSDNDWFDPTLANEDSMIAKAIEDNLFREGRLSPTSDEYWEEVDRRIAKRLPHLANKSDEDEEDEDERPQRREQTRRKPSGPKFATGGRERPLKKNEVYVSPERKKALVEMGAWDDPVLRDKYLRAYQRYDADSRRREK